MTDVSSQFREAEPVPISGSHITLEPLSDVHYPALHQLVNSADFSFRLKFQGRIVSAQEFAAVIWGGTIAQFIAVDRQTKRPVGWYAAYEASLRNGHAAFAIATWPAYQRTMASGEGTLLFLNYLFGNWPFRKLYAQMREYNVAQISSGAGSLYEVEGRLKDYTYYDGQYWDEVFIAVGRDRFYSYFDRLLTKITRTATKAGSQDLDGLSGLERDYA